MPYDFIYVICKVGHLFLFFCFFCYARSGGKEWKTIRTTIKQKKEFLPCKRAELERSKFFKVVFLRK